MQHAEKVGRGWRGQPHGKGVKICVPGVCRARALKVLGVLSTPLLPSSIPSHVLLLPGACRPSAKPDPLWEIKGTDPLWEINQIHPPPPGDDNLPPLPPWQQLSVPTGASLSQPLLRAQYFPSHKQN